jgi:hypothetical protein
VSDYAMSITSFRSAPGLPKGCQSVICLGAAPSVDEPCRAVEMLCHEATDQNRRLVRNCLSSRAQGLSQPTVVP